MTYVERAVQAWVKERGISLSDEDLCDVVRRIEEALAEERIVAIRTPGKAEGYCHHLRLRREVDLQVECEKWHESRRPPEPYDTRRRPGLPVREAPMSFVDWLSLRCRAQDAEGSDVTVFDAD